MWIYVDTVNVKSIAIRKSNSSGIFLINTKTAPSILNWIESTLFLQRTSCKCRLFLSKADNNLVASFCDGKNSMCPMDRAANGSIWERLKSNWISLSAIVHAPFPHMSAIQPFILNFCCGCFFAFNDYFNLQFICCVWKSLIRTFLYTC